MADKETPMAAPTDEPALEEAPAQEPVVDDAPAEDPGAADEPLAEDAAAEPPAAAPPEPVEIVHPKERRRRVRQRSSATPRPPSTPEERKAERDALRAKSAKPRAHRRHKLRERKPAATQAAAVEAAPYEPGTQKVRQGIVVSDKAAKTITVRIDTSRRHRRYQKIVRSSKTLHAHDENNEAHEGDLVKVIETRPLSASKRWRLAEVVERAR